jgi:fructose-bisphosphate aldolase, class I
LWQEEVHCCRLSAGLRPPPRTPLTHIAAQLGAHIVKVKLPGAHIEQAAAREVYAQERLPIETLADRVRHTVQCAFDGRHTVIFSGGPSEADEMVLHEIRAIRDGGGFGSIIGRNSFQCKKSDVP